MGRAGRAAGWRHGRVRVVRAVAGRACMWAGLAGFRSHSAAERRGEGAQTG
jgi:hypothetical protein